MFSLVKRANSVLTRTTTLSFQRRWFSPLAIYSRFPATLYHYSPKSKPYLLDRGQDDDRPQDTGANSVEIAADGLVYPKVTQYRRCTNFIFPICSGWGLMRQVRCEWRDSAPQYVYNARVCAELLRRLA